MSKTFIVFLSQCSVTCGSGQQTRQVKCTSQQGTAVADTKCDPEKKPLTTKSCDLKTPCPYWFAGKWTDVSKTFGISGVVCYIFYRAFKTNHFNLGSFGKSVPIKGFSNYFGSHG